jgi:hypothetical protein
LQQRYCKTVPINPEGNNVGTLWSEPGYSRANEVIAHMILKYDNITFDSEVIDIIIPDKQDFGVDEDGLAIKNNDITTVPADTDNKEINASNNEENQNQISLRENDVNGLIYNKIVTNHLINLFVDRILLGVKKVINWIYFDGTIEWYIYLCTKFKD